jgi:hypothetical protein
MKPVQCPLHKCGNAQMALTGLVCFFSFIYKTIKTNKKFNGYNALLSATFV